MEDNSFQTDSDGLAAEYRITNSPLFIVRLQRASLRYAVYKIPGETHQKLCHCNIRFHMSHIKTAGSISHAFPSFPKITFPDHKSPCSKDGRCGSSESHQDDPAASQSFQVPRPKIILRRSDLCSRRQSRKMSPQLSYAAIRLGLAPM